MQRSRLCFAHSLHYITLSAFQTPPTPEVTSGASTITCYEIQPTGPARRLATQQVGLHDQRFIVNFIVMSRQITSNHVMSRHVTSCHVMSRHVTSCHVTSCHVTCHVMSCRVTSCHVISRHATLCHVMSRHVTSCHVMSRYITSCNVMSRRKSRDVHMTNASLSTDFFHPQSIQIRHCVFVSCPKGCRYHTALAVYNLVIDEMIIILNMTSVDENITSYIYFYSQRIQINTR